MDRETLMTIVSWWLLFTWLLFMFIIPISLAFLLKKRPQWFSGWKIALWVIGAPIFSWTYINAPQLIVYWLWGIGGGVTAVMALFFGWAFFMIGGPAFGISCAIILRNRPAPEVKKS